VAGAAAGSGLAEGVRDSDGLADGVPDSGGLPEGVPDSDGLAETLVLAEAVAAPLDEMVGVGETLPAGENEDDVGSAEGVDPVQPETAAEESMATVPQPMRINLAPSLIPAIAVRTFTQISPRTA
jgi:hypothetical protein